MSATTATKVRPASTQAMRARTSARPPSGAGATTRACQRGPGAARRSPMASVPPTDSIRSRMFARPVPAVVVRRVEARAVVLDDAAQRVRPRPSSATRIVGRARVLGGVLHGLQAAEVRRRLDGRRSSRPTPVRDDLDRAPGCRRRPPGERGDQPVVRRAAAGRCRGTGAPGSRSASTAACSCSASSASARSGDRCGQRLGEPQVHRERDQVLLGAVVDVALEPPALGVLGVDQPLPRDAQLVGARRQLASRAARARRAAGPRAAPARPGSARPANSRSSTEVSGRCSRSWTTSTPSSSPPWRTGGERRPGRRRPTSGAGRPPGARLASGGQVAASVGRSPTTSQTWAHAAPVPSASTWAIRDGSSSAA